MLPDWPYNAGLPFGLVLFPSPPLPPKLFYVLIDNEQNGPLRVDQLKQLIEASKVNNESLVWEESLNDWTLITEVPSLSILFKKTPPPPPAI